MEYIQTFILLYDKLEHIEIDMVMPLRKYNWNFTTYNTKHINPQNHPLLYLNKFKKLKSLKITITDIYFYILNTISIDMELIVVI